MDPRPNSETTPALTPARHITRLGAPLVVGAISASTAGLVDSAMMGRFGSQELAAVAGAASVFAVFATLVVASTVGHHTLSARFAGRQDPEGIRRSLRSSFFFSGGIAVMLVVISISAGAWLTGLVTQGDPSLRQLGGQYMAARAPSLLFIVLFALVAAVFNAYQRTTRTMTAGIVANVANVVLNALLIFGHGPFPRLGVVGNGLATTISSVIGAAWLVVVARRSGLTRQLRKPGPRTPVDFEVSIPKLSSPLMFSMAVDYVSIAVFFAIVGGLGTAALGGGRIAFNLMILFFAIATAFAGGSRILIGRSLESDAHPAPTVLWRTSQRLVLAPAVVVGAVLVVIPRPIALMFSSFDPVVNATAEALPLIGVSVPVLAWTMANVNALRALGRMGIDMYGNIVALVVVQLPIAWLLTSIGGFGIRGAFVSVIGYWLARGAVTEVAARRALAVEIERRSSTAPILATSGS